MRDEQVRRYARHIALADIGGLGQTALLVAAAKLPLRDAEPAAELLAATYLAAGGVGTLIVPNASDAQRSELAAHGPDTTVVTDDTAGTSSAGVPKSREVVLAPRPAWWPGAEGDAIALAFWRGGLAAARWMADTATR